MWFLLILFFAVALVAGGLAARGYLTGEPILGNLLGPRPERRLGVVEQTTMDNRRKLVLIRRDGVEHLIMTGGPVDIVVETNIGGSATSGAGASRLPPKVLAESAEAASPTAPPPNGAGGSAAVFGRANRKLGQVVNE